MIRTVLTLALVLTLAACGSSGSSSSSSDSGMSDGDAIGLAVLGLSSGYNSNRGITCWNYGVMTQCR